MIAIIITSIMLYSYSFFVVVGVIKFKYLSKFDDCNIILSVFSVLYIRNLGLIYYSLFICTLQHLAYPPTALTPGNYHFTL